DHQQVAGLGVFATAGWRRLNLYGDDSNRVLASPLHQGIADNAGVQGLLGQEPLLQNLKGAAFPDSSDKATADFDDLVEDLPFAVSSGDDVAASGLQGRGQHLPLASRTAAGGSGAIDAARRERLQVQLRMQPPAIQAPPITGGAIASA